MTDITSRLEFLSPRQLEIFRLVAQRLSSKEIAMRLGVSPHTVDSHIAAVLRRLDLTSRRDAVIAMFEAGYMTPLQNTELSQLDNCGPEPVGHGDNPLVNRHPLPTSLENSSLIERAKVRLGNLLGSSALVGQNERGSGDGTGDGNSSQTTTMGRVVFRYLCDAFYITLFFAVMSAVAYGAHLIVIECEHRQIDPVVLVILRCVSYVLAALDAIGVTSATGLLTYRFIRAIAKADD